MRVAVLLLAALMLAATAGAGNLEVLDKKWRWVSDQRFELLTNASERRGREVIELLESFRTALAQLNGGLVADAPSPIRILLFDRAWDFAPYQIVDREGKPERFDGYFVGRGDVNWIALKGDTRELIPHLVYHEYTHFLIARQLGRLPPWLSEGLAEYFAGFRFLERTRRVEFGRPIVEHFRYLNSSPHAPLEQVLGMAYDSAEFARDVPRALFYSKSWLLVHYLWVGAPELAGSLARFAQNLEAGMDQIAALQSATGMSIRDLDDRLTAYQRKSLVHYATFDLRSNDATSPIAARPASSAEVAYRLGEFLQALDPTRKREADAHFAASGRPAPQPKIAYAAYVPEAAAAAIDSSPPTLEELRAELATDPGSAEAHSRLAIELYRQQAGSTHPDGELLAEARRELVTAAELDPFEAMHVTDLLRVYEIDRTATDFDDALAALAAAVERFPDDDRLRFGYADLLTRAGRADDARRIADAWVTAQGADSVSEELIRLLANLDAERAIELARAGKVDEAETLLQKRIAATPQADWRAQLERSLATIQASGRHNRARATYQRAVELSKAGRLEEAAQVLRELVASDPPPPIDELAKSVLGSLEDYLAARRRRSPSPLGGGS